VTAFPDGHYDVVVAGGGWAGAVLAKQLSKAGKTVLVLEAGGSTGATWEDYQANVEQYLAATIKVPNSPYLSSPNAESPSVLDITKIQPGGLPADTGYFVQEGPLPFSSDYLRSRAGTSLHWLGTCLRMLDNDFTMRTTYGQGIDWPMSVRDLNDYYEAAELDIGVAGDVADQDYCDQYWRPGYDFPMERIPQSYLDQTFAQELDGKPVRLDGGVEHPILVTSTPQGRNGVPREGFIDPRTGEPYVPVGAVGNPHAGQRCEGNSACIPICPVQAKWNANKTFAQADASKVTLQTQAVVSQVLTSSDGKSIAGIAYYPYPDVVPPAEPIVATGDVYVVAGGAIENAKLLLASNVANSSDQVGRNLMDHPYLLTWALMPTSVGAFRGPSCTSGFENLRDGTFRSERAAFRVDIANWGWDFAAFGPYSDVELALSPENELYGSDLRDWLAERVPRQIRLGFLLEQLPNPNNRVTVSKDYVDVLGQPRPVITYDLDWYTRAGFVEATAFSRQVFEYLGATDATAYNTYDPGYVTYQNQGYTYHGSGHVVGTHRMGNDPTASVVDVNQRSWDHENLYIVGCGSMPTIGTSNPTMTMWALLLKSCASILDDLGGPS
jgi:choline dehydrogenase-like flavoprotein